MRTRSGWRGLGVGKGEELRGRCRRNCVRRIVLRADLRAPYVARAEGSNAAGISGHRPDGKRSKKLPTFIKDGS